LLDPFLTGYERYRCLHEPPFRADEFNFADVVLGTHAHVDHIDPEGFPTLLRASPQSIGVVPAPLIDHVVSLDAPEQRLRGAMITEPIELSGIRITCLPAVHADLPSDGYRFWTDDAGHHKFLGYVIEMDGVRLCHVGDTLVYEGLADALRELHLDLLLLPINGRSWYREMRGLAGNMNVFEAAELAELSAARLTIPMHYDLFADNTEDPAHFKSYTELRHPRANVQVVERWSRLDILPAGS
jgi:L-ascorbate metabolism protein UlaG (beta-lactamase superfamily)